MRYQGPLYQWNDEKGYGFVEPNGGGTRAFVHIKEFADQTRRPALGDLLIYRLGQDEQGRPVAREICFVGGETPAHFERVEQFRRNSNQFTLLFCLLLAILTFMGELPIPVLLLYTGMSLATYLCYLVDKARAMQNGWRIAESTLLLLGLADLLDFLAWLYLLMIFAWALLSFVSLDARHPLVPLLGRLVEPALRPLRRLLPAPGGLDLSPAVAILIILILQALIVGPLLDLGHRLSL